MNELKNCGVEDLLIAVVDGLKGFPDAVTAVFPQATVQTCIVHLLRHSLDLVSGKARNPVAGALKGIDTACRELEPVVSLNSGLPRRVRIRLARLTSSANPSRNLPLTRKAPSACGTTTSSCCRR